MKKFRSWFKKVKDHAVVQTWKSSPKAPTVYEVGFKIPWPRSKKRRGKGDKDSQETEAETRKNRD